MNALLIRGGRIIDPSGDVDCAGNILIAEEKIVGLVDETAAADEVIDATGKIVCPGLIDIHASLREPGNDEDETIASGTAAALAGGFTSVACLPDTSPVVDNRAAAEFVVLQAERAGHCHVFPLGSVTIDHAGEELAEIGQLVDGGAVGFVDGKQPIANAEIMRRALEYARMFKRTILNSPQVPELARDGVMHEGYYSTLLGLRGIPAAAEDIMVGRDLALAELTHGHLHLMCVSTMNSVELIRRAKARGISVTASVTPHHISLNDAFLETFDANYKVQPPLRSPEHIDALIEGLRDGTIDVISSDHQPYASEKEDRELNLVPFGIVGLETLLPICVRSLIEPGHLDWPGLISRLTVKPAGVLGLDKGTLKPGADADVTIIDPGVEWTIDPTQFRSKGRNTPFGGWEVKGRADTVIVSGQVRYRAGS